MTITKSVIVKILYKSRKDEIYILVWVYNFGQTLSKEILQVVP